MIVNISGEIDKTILVKLFFNKFVCFLHIFLIFLVNLIIRLFNFSILAYSNFNMLLKIII